MGVEERHMSRRRLLASAGGGALIALPSTQPEWLASQGTPSAQGPVGSVEAPAWMFILHEIHDPYEGEIQAPPETPPGTRYVATHVEIVNDSDQALSVTPLDVRLRDEAGIEYRGGGAIGTEPSINPRSLNPGELSRGWVWFNVPADVRLVEVVYVAPAPQFRVPLSE